jgi:GNAT superfamily N-acetyltransferase
VTPVIRSLGPSEVALVAAFWREAPDYWLLAEGACDAEQKAAAFFTDAPPGVDGAMSHRLGLFLDGRLSGVAELAFGYPSTGDAFLGLMVLGPWAQRAGLGRVFLAHVEGLARAAGATALFLAVIDTNLRGRAFWERAGFQPTGVRRFDDAHRHWVARLRKPL